MNAPLPAVCAFQKRSLRRCTVVLLTATATMLAGSSTSRADPLLGDAMAAYSTAEAADANPANAGFLEQSQFVYIGEPIKDEQIKARYPGFDATTLATTGFSPPMARPALIWKIGPHIGVGGYVVPPLPITVNLKKEKIPVVILGAQNFVDMNVGARVDGLLGGTFGYRVNERWGFGFGLTHQAVKFKAKLSSSEGGDLLADASGAASMTSIIGGIRAAVIPGVLQIGLAADLISNQSISLDVQSPLLEGTGASPAAGIGGAKSNRSMPLGNILAGAQVGLGQRVRLLADVRWTRADKDQTGFSLVSLKQAKQDLHDTVSVRAGAILSAMPRVNLLMGFHYEPTNIGPGARGDQPLIGFGTINLVQVIAGLAPLTPYTMLAAGIQAGLIAKRSPSYRGSNRPEKGYYQLVLEGGVTYTYASLGIDANGELPGAYLYRKIGIPVGLIYRF